MGNRQTRSEILAQYPSEEFHQRLLRIRCLGDFLQASIIPEDYEVTANLVSPIRFTDAGQALLRRVHNNTTPRQASSLAIFLTLFWEELFIDPMETNIEAMEARISDELKRGRIKHPYLYGRFLYDKAFKESRDNKSILTHKETAALLKDTPAGIFQLADYVSGPYGLLKSKEYRFSGPTTWVPLYHCEDLSCDKFHLTYLSTGVAKIGKVRTRVIEILDKRSESPSDWDAILRDTVSSLCNPFSWDYSAGLISFLGDAFSERELQAILADLLDSTQGGLRETLKSANLTARSAQEFANDLNEAQALQLILLCTDSQIRDSLDCLILNGRIRIPVTELRKSIVGTEYSGYFDIEPECSVHGMRFASGGSLTLLRIRHLVSSLFDTSNEDQRERLEWIIRDAEGENFQEKLDHFVCQEDLDATLRSLIFDSRKNLETAMNFSGIGSRAQEHFVSDAQLSRAISWRLGISDAIENDKFTLLQRRGDQLRQLAMRTHEYSTLDQEEIRSDAANFFVALEEILSDYIKLATWSLLRDHYGSPDGFVYRVDEAVGHCSDIIAREQSGFELSEDGKWTLGPIIHSFGTLAKHLEGRSPDDENIRPLEDHPRILQNESPYSFLFRNRIPFLDLSTSSRKRIVAILKEATSKLASNHVDDVRNRTLHKSEEFPAQDEIIRAVTAAQTVLTEAEEAGLLPIPARQLERRQDAFDRRFITLGTPRGITTQFIRPSQHFLTGLPSLTEPQLIIRSAVYEGSSEVLRLRVLDNSDYSERWSNFPRRRHTIGRKISGSAGTVPET